MERDSQPNCLTLRGHRQNLCAHGEPGERSSDLTGCWARPAFECLRVSCGGVGCLPWEQWSWQQQSWEACVALVPWRSPWAIPQSLHIEGQEKECQLWVSPVSRGLRQVTHTFPWHPTYIPAGLYRHKSSLYVKMLELIRVWYPW